VIIYVNDSVGNIKSSSVRFTVDITYPNITFHRQNATDMNVSNVLGSDGLKIYYNIS
jgi:hypothetical protein